MRHQSERSIRPFVTILSALALIIVPFQFITVLGALVWIVEVGILVIFAFAVAPYIGAIIGKPTGSLFLGGARNERIPILSEAESALKRRDYQKARELYLEIQEQFPAYLPLYRSLFDLLLTRLQDRETARRIYRSGWNAMTGESRKKLEQLYREFSR